VNLNLERWKGFDERERATIATAMSFLLVDVLDSTEWEPSKKADVLEMVATIVSEVNLLAEGHEVDTTLLHTAVKILREQETHADPGRDPDVPEPGSDRDSA
jgi:transposase-like protein